MHSIRIRRIKKNLCFFNILSFVNYKNTIIIKIQNIKFAGNKENY